METKSWDLDSLKSEFSNCQSLGEIISSLESYYSKDGYVICRVQVNGMPFNESDEQKFSGSHLGEISNIQLDIDSIKNLLLETQLSTFEYANSIREHSLVVAELFRGQDLNAAHTEFKVLVEAVDSLFGAHQLMYNVMQQQNQDLGAGLAEFDMKSTQLLGEILSAYEKRDFILTADLLEYELTEILENYVSRIGELIGRHQKPEDFTLGR